MNEINLLINYLLIHLTIELFIIDKEKKNDKTRKSRLFI